MSASRYRWASDYRARYGIGLHHSIEDVPVVEPKMKVEAVDFLIEKNTKYHKTDRYEITHERKKILATLPAELVVRRGQSFDFDLTFDRPYNQQELDIRVTFTLDTTNMNEIALVSNGTKVSYLVSEEDYVGEWGARIRKNEGNKIKMRIYTPANAIVARWKFAFDVVKIKEDKSEEELCRYKHPVPFYILFNPWCREDQTFYPNTDELDEYVLNDSGRVFAGTANQINAVPWNFGQFEDFVLECVIWLLDNCNMKARNRGDPIAISRKISALVNSPDDNGVLEGRWNGDYRDGIAPLHWSGSVRILQLYWQSKHPVKYGQCWVFSGVLVTVCRALGIPCRSVTNFSSAHDTDGNITIDRHWDKDGHPIEEWNSDSVWNFHVWNEVWMARPDLPAGFGGWQAVDSTPQERSDGTFCCGPASVEAVKQGRVDLPYDGRFIFAEVNADRVNWIKISDNFWANTKEEDAIGKNITTKGLGDEMAVFVTNNYKYCEGDVQERTAVLKAVHKGTGTWRQSDLYSVDIKDMTFDLTDWEDTMIGQPFSVVLKVKNDNTLNRTVKVTLTASVVYYNGVMARMIKSESYEVQIKGKKEGVIKMNVTPEEYLDKLVDMAIIKMSTMVRVLETNQYYCEDDDFRFLKPEIVVKAPAEVKVGDTYDVEFSFTNPLPYAMTMCQWEVEGAGLQKPRRLYQPNVERGEVAKKTTIMQAKTPGDREIIVNFDSTELMSVMGTATVKVTA